MKHRIWYISAFTLMTLVMTTTTWGNEESCAIVYRIAAKAWETEDDSRYDELRFKRCHADRTCTNFGSEWRMKNGDTIEWGSRDVIFADRVPQIIGLWEEDWKNCQPQRYPGDIPCLPHDRLGSVRVMPNEMISWTGGILRRKRGGEHVFTFHQDGANYDITFQHQPIRCDVLDGGYLKGHGLQQ